MVPEFSAVQTEICRFFFSNVGKYVCLGHLILGLIWFVMKDVVGEGIKKVCDKTVARSCFQRQTYFDVSTAYDPVLTSIRRKASYDVQNHLQNTVPGTVKTVENVLHLRTDALHPTQ